MTGFEFLANSGILWGACRRGADSVSTGLKWEFGRRLMGIERR